MSTKVNIIIPVYNEAKRIQPTLESLFKFLSQNLNIDIHAYLVNDGSIDDSYNVISTLIKDKKNITLLSYKENRGKGYAFKYGVENSRDCDYHYLADADGSADWSVLHQFLRIAENENIDCVIASRAVQNSKTTRNITSKTFSFVSNILIKLILNIPYNDTQCGYKLFSKNCYPYILGLQIERFGFDFELIKKLHDAHISIKEVGINWVDKDGSKVKLSDYAKTFKDLMNVKKIIK